MRYPVETQTVQHARQGASLHRRAARRAAVFITAAATVLPACGRCPAWRRGGAGPRRRRCGAYRPAHRGHRRRGAAAGPATAGRRRPRARSRTPSPSRARTAGVEAARGRAARRPSGRPVEPGVPLRHGRGARRRAGAAGARVVVWLTDLATGRDLRGASGIARSICDAPRAGAAAPPPSPSRCGSGRALRRGRRERACEASTLRGVRVMILDTSGGRLGRRPGRRGRAHGGRRDRRSASRRPRGRRNDPEAHHRDAVPSGARTSRGGRRRTEYAPVKMAFVHHTVNANAYTRAQAPGHHARHLLLRRQGPQWSDLGYNFSSTATGRSTRAGTGA